jgi:hypothetical protein
MCDPCLRSNMCSSQTPLHGAGPSTERSGHAARRAFPASSLDPLRAAKEPLSPRIRNGHATAAPKTRRRERSLIRRRAATHAENPGICRHFAHGANGIRTRDLLRAKHGQDRPENAPLAGLLCCQASSHGPARFPDLAVHSRRFRPEICLRGLFRGHRPPPSRGPSRAARSRTHHVHQRCCGSSRFARPTRSHRRG